MVTVLFSSQYMLLIRWYDGRQICLGPKPSQNSSLSSIASPQRRATDMGPSTLSCLNYSSFGALPSHTPVQICQGISWLDYPLHHLQKTWANLLRRAQTVWFSQEPLCPSPSRRWDVWPLPRILVWHPLYAKACWYQLHRNPILCLHFHYRDLGSSSRSSLRLIRTSSTTSLRRTDGLLMSWMTKEKQSWEKWWPRSKPWPQICSL